MVYTINQIRTCDKSRMSSKMGEEPGHLEILKCKRMNVGSVNRPGSVKVAFISKVDEITCLRYEQALNSSLEFN